jgi:beta-glucosidase
VLPLKPEIKKIAVVGPLADQTRPLIGNYAGQPTHIVSILDGLKAEFPNATITYVPGTQFLRSEGGPVPNSILTTPDGKPGLKADYSEGMMRRPPLPGEAAPPPPAQLASRTEPNVNLSDSNLPSELAGRKSFSVQWTGFITAPESGDYLVGVRGRGFARLSIDGKQTAMMFGGAEVNSGAGRVHLEKGRKTTLSINYGNMNGGKPDAQLIWAKVSNVASPEAIAAAKNADVVIAVVGITSALEGEQMPVTEPGFLGGDRTSIDMPDPEEGLVEAVAATGKPLAVVLINGSALAVNWINEHANAVLEAWYPGEEGGSAVAETLSGRNNPAGRLPVTFYKDVNQLPHFEDYGMANRTYRYFRDKPLYPFGYGLSYTTFKYSDLTLPAQTVAAGQPVAADVTVTNTGKAAGDEAVQLYLKFPNVKGAPQIALRGFERIHLDAGASQKLHFELKDRDLGMVTDAGDPIIAAGDYTLVIGGGQPDTGAPTVSGHFQIDSQLALPE